MSDRNELDELLDRYNEAPAERRTGIAGEIERRFRVAKAILVLDMSGFTRTVRRYGIVHYLGMMRRMRIATEPLVGRFAGSVIKYEADNLYAAFDTVDDAIAMAVAAMDAFRTMNAATEDHHDIHVCVGIAWGDFLVVPHGDMYGDAVNVACKLGEDLARAGEILLAESARAVLAEPGRFRLEETVFAVAGLELRACYVRY